MRTLIRGFLAGAAATLPMSFFLWTTRQLGLLGTPPPRKISGRLLGEFGIHRPSRGTETVTMSALHIAFGAGAGAFFALLFRLTGRRSAGWLQGIAYATAVWGVSYYGWVPGLGIMPPPDRDRPGRPRSMLLAHWVYGSVLGAIVARSSAR